MRTLSDLQKKIIDIDTEILSIGNAEQSATLARRMFILIGEKCSVLRHFDKLDMGSMEPILAEFMEHVLSHNLMNGEECAAAMNDGEESGHRWYTMNPELN